jgi:hypothetical protein
VGILYCTEVAFQAAWRLFWAASGVPGRWAAKWLSGRGGFLGCGWRPRRSGAEVAFQAAWRREAAISEQYNHTHGAYAMLTEGLACHAHWLFHLNRMHTVHPDEKTHPLDTRSLLSHRRLLPASTVLVPFSLHAQAGCEDARSPLHGHDLDHRPARWLPQGRHVMMRTPVGGAVFLPGPQLASVWGAYTTIVPQSSSPTPLQCPRASARRDWFWPGVVVRLSSRCPPHSLARVPARPPRPPRPGAPRRPLVVVPWRRIPPHPPPSGWRTC